MLLLLAVSFIVAMGKRAAADSTAPPIKSNNSSLDVESRNALRAELVASSRGTKQSIANVLTTLQSKGLLNDAALGASSYEHKKLAGSVDRHAYAQTPHGAVVQPIHIDTTDGTFT